MGIDWNDPALEAALDEADVDDRVGDHTVIVDAVEQKTWDDGNVSYNVTCLIETARFSKFYARFGTAKSADELGAMKEAAKSDGALMGRYKGAAADTRNQRVLAKEYGLSDIADVGKGFRFAAKLVKNKDGYIRMAAVLPKASMGGGGPVPDENVPF